MSERTVVAVSSSLDRDYAFLVPFTACLWRRIGHEPLVMLVGTPEDWQKQERTCVIWNALKERDIHFVCIGREDGYPDHSFAQNCRQHASAFDFISENDWVMPADADLWPIRRDFYHQHEGKSHRAVLYYSNGDHFVSKENCLERAARGQRSQTIPTCHVAMRARDWRTIYGLIPNRVALSVKNTLDAYFKTISREDSMNLWMSDQQIMTQVLCQQPWFPSGPIFGDHGSVLAVQRAGHPPADRLCRSHPSHWRENAFEPERWVDAHMHKDPSGKAWPLTLPLVQELLPELASWAVNYREQYAAVEVEDARRGTPRKAS